MKKYLALLLAFVLVLGLFAGCGEKAENEPEEETEIPQLAKGWYEILDDEEETAGYLHSTGKKLTVFNALGEELMAETKFSYDEEEEAFVIGGKAAFTLEVGKKTTTLSVPKKSPLGLDKGDYTLEEAEESDVPVPGGSTPMPEPDPDPVPEPEPQPEPEPEPEPVVSDAVPFGDARLGDRVADFTVELCDGTSISLYGLLESHDLVMVNLWATWCGPCQAEFPYMEQAYEQMKDRVGLICLSIDDTSSEVAAFRSENGLNLPMGTDTINAGNQVLEGIPTTLLIDRFGTLVFYECGSIQSVDRFLAMWEPYLGSGYTASVVDASGLPREYTEEDLISLCTYNGVSCRSVIPKGFDTSFWDESFNNIAENIGGYSTVQSNQYLTYKNSYITYSIYMMDGAGFTYDDLAEDIQNSAEASYYQELFNSGLQWIDFDTISFCYFIRQYVTDEEHVEYFDEAGLYFEEILMAGIACGVEVEIYAYCCSPTEAECDETFDRLCDLLNNLAVY